MLSLLMKGIIMAEFISCLIFGAIIYGLCMFFVHFYWIFIIAIILFVVYEIFWRVFEEFYYNSEKFLNIKESLKNNAQKCNDLNIHVQELANVYMNIHPDEQGNASYNDTSIYNFARPKHLELKNKKNIYDCSLSVCRNARMQPIKYLCKYFNINSNKETLDIYEKILNDYAAAEQGKQLLLKERDDIINSLDKKVPYMLRVLRKKSLLRALGFDDIKFKGLYFPKYSFRYISAGGNSSLSCDIVLDMTNLENLVDLISQKVKYKKSVAGQRALMTRALREKIKARDNYTCQCCGLSTKQEPNLLLEIDHIIPVSKGGITSEENLQTLCWRCNRAKSNKI